MSSSLQGKASCCARALKEPIGHPFPSELTFTKIRSRLDEQHNQPRTYLNLEYPRGFRVGGGGGSAPSREHVNALGLLMAVVCGVRMG